MNYYMRRAQVHVIGLVDAQLALPHSPQEDTRDLRINGEVSRMTPDAWAWGSHKRF